MKKIINNVKRYERKWVFKNINSLELIIGLLRSKLLFNFQYEKRKVNSLYFDDKNLSSIRENLDGVSEKTKYRIRWYGNKNIVSSANFEIKKKKEFETNKKTFHFNDINDLNILEDTNINHIEELVNHKFNIKKNVFAILTTHYDREYFISNNNLIRATIDYNLESRVLNNKVDKNIIKNYHHYITLEIKYDTNLDHFVRNNLENINNRLSRNSKFVNSALTEAFSYS
ncbi:MAG: hypothetical protein CBC25_00670 [Pelagibacteraceae bacterium TMED65]|nr:MAG: hypothetical protein CBC25_00670 [Pelagibacteraceae bacterium TMED65]|tara:strand:+ start:5316 stop:5999 length:684 start_codon:yes stop_codon:yes gene_type:complete